jgi:exosortase K
MMLTAAFALKWWYRSATVDELAFVLLPTTTIVGLLANEAWTFIAGEGFLFPGSGILIDRSCSGVNFLVITAATFAFVILRHRDAGCGRPLLALLAVAGAYGLTVLANSGRILTLMGLERIQLHLSPAAHEVLGAFFFLASLLLATLLLQHIISRPPPAHAQPA